MQGGQTNRSCRRSEAGSEVDKRCRDVRGIEPHKSQTIQQTKQIRFAGFLCSIVIGFGQVCSQMTFDFNMNGPSFTNRWEVTLKERIWSLPQLVDTCSNSRTEYLLTLCFCNRKWECHISFGEDWKDVPWSAPLPKFPSFDLQAQWASFETGWSSRFGFCVEVSKGKEKLLKEQGPWKWYDLRRRIPAIHIGGALIYYCYV